MSDASGPEDPAVKAMRLRPDPPRPLRLSRKVVMGGCAGLAVAIAAATAVGLFKPDAGAPAAELLPSSAPPSEAVRALPRDYTAPRLGPPLPGDLGKPVLNARNAEAAAGDRLSTGARDAAHVREADARRTELERRRAEADAARMSAVLLTSVSPHAQGSASPSAAPTPGDEDGPGRVARAAGLLAGSIIEASLVTGIRSDLPGPVLGQVTADVHDSLTGRRLLVPKGSRLIGSHTAQIAQGQSRIQVTWSRIILPNGQSIALGSTTASDRKGYAGLEDRTDQRWSERFRSVVLTTLLAVGGAAAQSDDETRVARAIREGASGGMDAVGRGVVERGLSIPPRLTIRPGFAFRLILAEDLDLAPYGD